MDQRILKFQSHYSIRESPFQTRIHLHVVNNSVYMDLVSMISASDIGERRIDGTGSVLAESEAVVSGGEPPRKWEMLFFCISRWFLIRKMLNSEVIASRKKQKNCTRSTGHPFSNPNGGACEMIDGSNNIEFPNPWFDQEILNSDMTSFPYYDPFSAYDVEFTDDIPLAIGYALVLMLEPCSPILILEVCHIGQEMMELGVCQLD